MTHQDLLAQRRLDGVLDPAQAAGLEASLRADPSRAAALARLTSLDHDLRTVLPPPPATIHEALLARIRDRLPAQAPTPARHLQVVDVLVAVAMMALVLCCLMTAGTLAHGSPLVLVLACVGLLGGVLLLLVTAMLRRAYTGILRSWLGARFAFGPSQTLAVRGFAIGLMIGGIYLVHLH